MQRKVAYVVLKDGGKLYIEESFGILEEKFISKKEEVIIHVKTDKEIKEEKIARKDIEYIGQTI